MNNNQDKIRREAQARGIQNLFHFTPFENLKGILEHGLIDRGTLEAVEDYDFCVTDTMRLDGYIDSVSLSIEGLNESMLEAKRKIRWRGWVVLQLDASILWTHNCRFCWTNAASKDIQRKRGFMGGPWAFGEMFAHFPVSPSDPRSIREVHDLEDRFPTYSDAEVMVSDPISPELITGIGVEGNWRIKQVQGWGLIDEEKVALEVMEYLKTGRWPALKK